MSKLEHEIAAICNTDEGANDLFRRLDEFIKNRQAMAKPVQMEKIFEQLKNVLKKGVKGPIKYENCLHIMAQISSANPEMFIDGETPQLILKGFEKMIVLKCSDKHESRRISTIGNVLEIVAAISDVSEDGKSAVVDFVLPCLNLLADKQQHITIRVEANRFLNGTIESFLRLNRDLDLPQLAFVSNFDDLIVNAGDLELQLCMAELICRMLPGEMRQLYAQMWFKQYPGCRDDFIAIRDVEFETDCRKFVNNMNERQLENRSVYSVLCKEVYLGVQKVNCPSDDGDNGMFWTDFSLGSKSISFFAIDEENDVWETVTIREDAVLQTQILEKKESHEAILLVQLNKPACTLLLSVDQSDEKYVKFIYDEKNSPLTPASLLFPKDYADLPVSPDVIASTPKASVTSNAVRISSRAKGLSKTVSLSTPRRRKEKGESSDESSKPNDPASSKDKQSKKPIPIPNKKDASSSDGKGDNTQIKNPAVPDEKKKQRSSRISGKAQESDTGKVSDSDGSASKGNKGTNRKPGKVKESSMPEIVQVVSGDERSTVRTRSIRSNDAGKHNDQNKTEIEQRGKGGEENGMDNTDEMKKGRDNRSMDESGLGRSIDSGLGKSMDIQDLTMEDGHVKKGEHVKKEELVKKEGHVKCLQDISQDEPTVIHATQTFSQEGMDDHTHLDDEVFSKDLDEDPLSVIAKKSGVDDGAKDVNVDVDRDSSSGPFTKASVSEKTISKRKERGVEQDKGESSTPYKKKTTKPVKAKAGAKTRQIRTRAAAKKNASVGSSVSTSESDITITKQTSKARAKSAEPGSKASKAITSSRSVSDLDKRNKLGSGYNTEDWMMDYSDLERRTERKKALENASNVSKSRLSLISTVYRENYRTDYKFKRKKFENPYEFKTSPPAKRSPQGKKLLRPALRTYQLKKQAELQQKREKKGNKADKLLSYNDDEEMPEMKENEKSFSDIALEVQRKHRERELRKHDSESDILNRRRDSEPDEQSTTEILNDWKEKSKTRRNLEQGAFKKVEENEQNKENEKDGEGTAPVEAGDVLDPPADGIDSSQTLRFDDQQVLANVTAEPDQESLDGDSLSNLLKTIRDDKPAGFEENVKKNTEDHVEKNGVRRTKDKEIIDKERDKKAMENHEGEDKESSRKTNDESENLTKKSKRDTSLDRLVPPGIQNSLMDEESKMLLNHVFGRDDEDGDLWIGAKENKNQVDTSRSQRGTKPRANSNHENPAQTSARDTNTDRARGKQKSTGEEIVELDEIFDDGNGDSLLEPKQTKRNTAKRTRSASDNTARLPGEKQEAGRGDILEEDDVYADESADELEEMSPRPAKKRIPRDRKYVKEHKDGEGDLSSGTALILDAFKKNFERIIEDSDDCVDLPTKTNKSSTSRKQSETISKNKKTVKSSKRRESPLREDHLYHPHEPSKFEASTPQAKLSRSTDSGFFDKTLSSSSKKRTPSSAKGDVQDKTPGGTVSRKSRRFGCLDVQSTGHTPRRGYHSNDDKRTSRIQEEYESGEEDCNLFSHSQPASINQGSRKRKGSRERETGFKSESKMQKRNKGSAKDDDFEYPDSITELIKGMDDQDYVNESFKTPVDNQSMPIQPRKLFQSSDHSAPRKRQKVSRERQRANDDDEDDDDEDIENPFDDEDSIGEEMQTSFINLGKEVKKTIKQRQDYVSQIASATMKLITAKSEEMWSKQSSRRHTLMNEFTSCVNKYVEDHQQITSKRQQIEDDMITQVKNHLEALAKQRKEQEKCLRGIIKTQKAFTETFKSIEDAEQSQRMDFLDSLRKELKRYRDQAAQEVQKQEFENIKRRIQAMLGMSL